EAAEGSRARARCLAVDDREGKEGARSLRFARDGAASRPREARARGSRRRRLQQRHVPLVERSRRALRGTLSRAEIQRTARRAMWRRREPGEAARARDEAVARTLARCGRALARAVVLLGRDARQVSARARRLQRYPRTARRCADAIRDTRRVSRVLR